MKNKKSMIKIHINKAGNLEKSLKDFKRKFSRLGIVEELRDRQHFTKKSTKNREKLKKAKYRQVLPDQEIGG